MIMSQTERDQHAEKQTQEQLAASGAQAGMQTAARSQEHKIENQQFLNELRKSDIDSDVFGSLEQQYPSWFSGAHAVTNRSDSWDTESDLLMMNKRERAYCERNPGRLLRDRPMLLAIAQGRHEAPRAEPLSPMKSRERRAVYGAVTGSVISLVGLGLFVWAYPYNWAAGSGPTYSVQVLFIYGIGLAALLAATGGALVAYHIDRARPRPGDFAVENETEETESFSDDRIESDIESAMEDVDLTWGGVERTEGTDLKIRPSEGEADMDVDGLDVDAERVHRSGVDEQVAGLAMVKGGQKKTARSESTVDHQTDQLAKLRERKRTEAETEDEETVLGTTLNRVANLLGRN